MKQFLAGLGIALGVQITVTIFLSIVPIGEWVPGWIAGISLMTTYNAIKNHQRDYHGGSHE